MFLSRSTSSEQPLSGAKDSKAVLPAFFLAQTRQPGFMQPEKMAQHCGSWATFLDCLRQTFSSHLSHHQAWCLPSMSGRWMMG